MVRFYFKTFFSFFIKTKGTFLQILFLFVLLKNGYSQPTNIDFKNKDLFSKVVINKQVDILNGDTSLKRRIIEKQNATINNSNFISGTSLAKTTSSQPEQDCNNAISVCQNTYDASVSYLGFGNSNEIPSSSSCLGTNENNSVWYTFTTNSSGSLAFEITPYNLTDDYDFALYDITGNNCSDISTGAITPIRCNFSATRGVTGLSSNGINASESAAGINQSSILSTTSGKTYVLVLCNFSSSLYGYKLDFTSGTATIFDNTLPFTQSVIAPCGSNFINFIVSEQIKCNSIATNASDFTLSGTGGPYTISSAIGINCGANSNKIKLSISPILTGVGPWTVGVQAGSDGNTLIDVCGNAMNSSIITFSLSPPNISISGAASICIGSTATLTASGANSYTWSTGSNSLSTSVTPSVTTTYTVKGIVNSLGCSDSITKTISVFSNSIAISPTTQTICEGSTAMLTGSGAQTYTWNGVFSPNPINVSPIVNTTYTVTGTNSCGTYTSYATINVTPISGSITCSPSASICSGSSVTLTATGGNTYSWSPTASLSGANSYTTVASPSVSTNYSLTITNSSGCSRTYLKSIMVYTNSIGVSPASQTICEGASAIIFGNGAQTYTWSPGFVIGSNIIVQPTVTATYSLTATNVCGTYTNSALINVVPISGTITGNPSFSICSGSSTTLSATGGSNYIWSLSTAISSTNTPAIIVSPTITTNYLMSMTNIAGCTRKYSKTVYVYNNSISITPASTQVCKGNSVLLSGLGAQTYTWNTGASTSGISVSPPANTVYTLSGTNPCGTFSSAVAVTVNTISTSISSNPSYSICPTKSTSLTATGGASYVWSPSTTLSSSTSPNVVASPTISTIYTLTATSAASCVKTSTVLVFVSPIYTLTSSVSQPSICIGKTSTLSVNGALNYTWAPSTNLSNTSGSVVVASPSTTIIYTITAANALGCIQNITQNLVLYPNFNLNINSILDENCANLPVNLIANVAPTGTYNYNWYPSTMLNSGSIFNPEFTTSLAGKYDCFLTVTDQYGCIKNDTTSIKIVLCEIKTYSGFSPNNDGHNDTWIIDGIERAIGNEVIILNKWGQVVWEMKEYNNADKVFKGNNKTGEALTDGTYFFVLTTLAKTYKGRVEIIR